MKEESNRPPPESGVEGSKREGAGWAAGLWGSEFWEPLPQLYARFWRTQGTHRNPLPPNPSCLWRQPVKQIDPSNIQETRVLSGGFRPGPELLEGKD